MAFLWLNFVDGAHSNANMKRAGSAQHQACQLTLFDCHAAKMSACTKQGWLAVQSMKVSREPILVTTHLIALPSYNSCARASWLHHCFNMHAHTMQWTLQSKRISEVLSSLPAAETALLSLPHDRDSLWCHVHTASLPVCTPMYAYH